MLASVQPGSLCTDDFTAEELVSAASLDARTSWCISVSSMSRRLPVAFVTSVRVSFDSSFSLHSLTMSSTCLLFDFHSDPCRLHLTPLHELRFPFVSPPYLVFLIRGMIFVSKCAIRTHSVSFDSASLPLEGKLVPRCTTTHPWFSETKVVGTSITSSPVRMLVTSSQHLSVSCSSFHVVMLLQPTLVEWCCSFSMTFVATMLCMIPGGCD